MSMAKNQRIKRRRVYKKINAEMDKKRQEIMEKKASEKAKELMIDHALSRPPKKDNQNLVEKFKRLLKKGK